MGNAVSIAMGLVAPEEDEVVTKEMVVDEEGSGGEEEQKEEPVGEVTEAEGDVEREEQDEAVLQCSICLDAVVGGGEERSTARLMCGHEFHLDCIGSAFNSRGVMQCPNCRQIERGNWLYARDDRAASQHVDDDDWVSDEDLYEFVDQPDVFMPFRLQGSPINRLLELPSLFDEMDLSQETTSVHDIVGQNFNARHTAISEPGTGQQGPYVAYLQPVSPLSITHIVEVTANGSAYHDHWNNPLAGPSDSQPLHRVPQPIGFPHNNIWPPLPAHSYSPPNNDNGGVAEQPRIPVGATRIGGVDSGRSQQRGSENGLDPSYFYVLYGLS